MKTVWTIGHSTRSLSELLELLQEHGITLLVDVRAFPTSARFPHFAREELSRRLAEGGIQYRWLGAELGGYRKQTDPHSPHHALRSRGFRNYADHMARQEFHQGVAELERLARQSRLAVMCAEKLWWRCHRSLLSDYLQACRNFDVLHIVERGKSEPHTLHRAARLVEGKLIYDVVEPAALF